MSSQVNGNGCVYLSSGTSSLLLLLQNNRILEYFQLSYSHRYGTDLTGTREPVLCYNIAKYCKIIQYRSENLIQEAMKYSTL